MVYSFDMKFLLFTALLHLASGSTERVVTDFDCEVTGHSSPQWGETNYGAYGGVEGGHGSFSGRLFEFDCQTGACRDSEGEFGHWWVTCGYSWKNVNDISDADLVVVDVKTEASNNHGSCYDDSYTRVLDIDATGWDAIDSQNDQGHWGFWFCVKKEPWSTVKQLGLEVVSDIRSQTSPEASDFEEVGQWDTHNGGQAKAYGDGQRTAGWLYLFAKKDEPSFVTECSLDLEATKGSCPVHCGNVPAIGVDDMTYHCQIGDGKCAKTECVGDEVYNLDRCEAGFELSDQFPCYSGINPDDHLANPIGGWQTSEKCAALCDDRADCAMYSFKFRDEREDEVGHCLLFSHSHITSGNTQDGSWDYLKCVKKEDRRALASPKGDIDGPSGKRRSLASPKGDMDGPSGKRRSLASPKGDMYAPSGLRRLLTQLEI